MLRGRHQGTDAVVRRAMAAHTKGREGAGGGTTTLATAGPTCRPGWCGRLGPADRRPAPSSRTGVGGRCGGGRAPHVPRCAPPLGLRLQPAGGSGDVRPRCSAPALAVALALAAAARANAIFALTEGGGMGGGGCVAGELRVRGWPPGGGAVGRGAQREGWTDRERGGAEWRGLRVRDGGGPGNGDGQPTGGRGRRPPRLVGLASPQGGGGAANGVASSTPAAPGWRHASSHAPADGSRGAVPQPRNAVARAPARGRRWWWVGERALSVRGLDRIDPVPGLDHSIHAFNSSEKMICYMGWPRNCTSQV